MGLDVQARALLTSAQRMGQEIFGTKSSGVSVTLDYNDGQFKYVAAFYSPLRTMKQTEEPGFLVDHDSTVRIAKSALPVVPKDGDRIMFIENGTVERRLRVEEIGGSHPLSVTWVLGCKAIN